MTLIHQVRSCLQSASLLALAAFGVGVVSPRLLNSAPTPAAPPFSTSHYVSTTSSTALYDMGCRMAETQSASSPNQLFAVILAWGQPLSQNGLYGTSIFSNTFRSTAQLAEAGKSYAEGYYNCAKNGIRLRLAMGTSNYGSYVTKDHGRAWGQMVTELNAWAVTKGYSSKVAFRGANDIEMDWGTPANARAWVDGYDEVVTGIPLYNYGDAAGCPQSGSNTGVNGKCNNTWTQSDVWYVSWGMVHSFPFPQIYTTTSSQARQWYQLSLYSALNHGENMRILGTMTQDQACQGQACTGIDNTPSEGWTQLFNLITADERTAQTMIPFSTDISWEN